VRQVLRRICVVWGETMIQFITWLLSPFNLFLVFLFIGLFGKKIRLFKADSKVGYKLACVGFWGLFLISQPLFVNLFGTFLEYPYPYIQVEAQPECDAIVLLGGGMGAPKKEGDLPEMSGAADRVWHAARLWHAGKAQYIIPTGSAEQKTSLVLLKDLGVPESAIIVENQAVNTVENGVYTRKLVDRLKLNKKVLLVTSASHMRRSIMIFKAVGLSPVPAAVDHEATYGGWLRIKDTGVSIWHFLPSSSSISTFYSYYKELFGLIGDRVRVRMALKNHGLGGAACGG